MQPRFSDRYLLLMLLAQMQEHAHQVRRSLDDATAALALAREQSAGVSAAAQRSLEAVRSGLEQIGHDAGEMQAALAASTGHIPRES